MFINDDYQNACVGVLMEVADRSWGNPDRRMIVVECRDPFTTIVVRTFVKNWEDAMLLVDREVCVYDSHVHPFVR